MIAMAEAGRKGRALGYVRHSEEAAGPGYMWAKLCSQVLQQATWKIWLGAHQAQVLMTASLKTPCSSIIHMC